MLHAYKSQEAWDNAQQFSAADDCEEAQQLHIDEQAKLLLAGCHAEQANFSVDYVPLAAEHIAATFDKPGTDEVLALVLVALRNGDLRSAQLHATTFDKALEDAAAAAIEDGINRDEHTFKGGIRAMPWLTAPAKPKLENWGWFESMLTQLRYANLDRKDFLHSMILGAITMAAASGLITSAQMHTLHLLLNSADRVQGGAA